jgi:hypothetical protein
MAYVISHPPAADLGPAAIWVANGAEGNGKWYSPAQFRELLGLPPADSNEVTGPGVDSNK